MKTNQQIRESRKNKAAAEFRRFIDDAKENERKGVIRFPVRPCENPLGLYRGLPINIPLQYRGPK